MPAKEKISIIGGGSWATAIAKILSTNGHDITWWLRQPETVDYIRKYGHNPKYLSSVRFDLPAANITNDLKAAISGSDYIVLGIPSYYLTGTLEKAEAKLLAGKVIISAVKGIVQDGHQLVSQYVHKRFGVPDDHIANISGPCHAEEVAAEKLSYLTFASPNIELAKKIAGLFENRFMHTRWSDDLQGTEYASVLKNVYALACGIGIGVGYGDNFMAVLVTKAMHEMEYFLTKMLPRQRDILAPAYLGDTLVTCYSQYSRNRTFGLMIGKGYTINSAILELQMVAEGYYATKSLNAIAQQAKLEMPILRAVYHILYERISPTIEFRVLEAQLK
jgi:glycerol-3-phosphate dehydrogenase (NAD(P)+)